MKKEKKAKVEKALIMKITDFPNYKSSLEMYLQKNRKSPSKYSSYSSDPIVKYENYQVNKRLTKVNKFIQSQDYQRALGEISRLESKYGDSPQMKMQFDFLKAQINQKLGNNKKYKRFMDNVVSDLQFNANRKETQKEVNQGKTIANFADLAEEVSYEKVIKKE